MKISVILLAAGESSRLNYRISKPLILINRIPVIIYSLRLFSSQAQVKEIIIAVNKNNELEIARNVKKFGIGKVKCFIKGGAFRQDSVRNALVEISSDVDLVLIHDAARPFVKKAELNSLIKKAKTNSAAILAVPVKATIKEVTRLPGHKVIRTLDRSNLWEAQTPQVFKKDLILKAYQKFGNTIVTDDASLVEKFGEKVRVVLSSYDNIKITTPEDLAHAEAIAKKCIA